MTFVHVLLIVLATIGLFFAGSLVYGLLCGRKDNPSDATATVEKGFLTSAIINNEECPYVFSSPKRIYTESNSSIFMTMSAVLDGREFPNLKIGETLITFIQAVGNSNCPYKPEHLKSLIIEKNGVLTDIQNGQLPTDLPKEIIMKVRNGMGWGPVDFEAYHRTSFMSSFAVPVSDFESFAKDITMVKLGYKNESEDILLSESSFVTIKSGAFSKCIKTAVLEWAQAIREKVDSVKVAGDTVKK